jgi:flagellar biosynthesis/type III secretory pathway chaperone
MPLLQDHLKLLESLLVKEFRACQALLNLTRDECEALGQGDVLRLLVLAEHKEILLDRLNSLENARQLQVAQLVGLDHEQGDDSVTQNLKILDLDGELQLVNLFEGIQVLKGQVRELVRGNRALAATALNQAAALQAGLVSHTQTSLPALFAAILAARDALDAQDSAAVSVALGELQNALLPNGQAPGDRLVRAIQSPETTTSVESPTARLESPGSKIEANMIEYMANLYRQEKAYRAVLKASSRMLASA